MKMTFQMELNVSGEKDLRRWRKLEHRQQAASQRELMGWLDTGSRLAAELLDQLSARKRQPTQGVAIPLEPLPFAPAESLRTGGAPMATEIDPIPFRNPRGGALDPLFADAGREPRRRRSRLPDLLKRKPALEHDEDELAADATLSEQVQEAGEAMKRFGERFRRLERAVRAAGLLDRSEAEPDPVLVGAGVGGRGLNDLPGRDAV
jgi:hypothetical protein